MTDFTIKQAQRKGSKITVLLSGPTNSGKTMSALLLAYGICNDWSKICVIDSENRRASHYDYLGPFNVLDFEPPYTVPNYIKAIETAEKAGMKVIIGDSLSHFWEGRGGILDVVSEGDEKNSFANWKAGDKLYQQLIEKILAPKVDMIFTARSKMAYVLNRDEKTKKLTPERMGLKPKVREGMEFEFTIGFYINAYHKATCTKDTTQLFQEFKDVQLDSDHGRWMKQWADNVSKEEIMKGQVSGEELRDKIIAEFKSKENLMQLDQTKRQYAAQINGLSLMDMNECLLAYGEKRKEFLQGKG